MQSISLMDDYSVALLGGLMKQDLCPYVPCSCWLTTAVQAALLPCSRSPLYLFFHFCLFWSSSPSLPLFAAWLCLSSLLSRSPLIRSSTLQLQPWMGRKRNWLQSIQQQIELYWLVPSSCRLELCYLLITVAIPSQHHWNGWVCAWECGGIIWPWEKSLHVFRDFFPEWSGPYEIGGLVLVGQESWREGVPGTEVFPLFTVTLSGRVSVTGNALFSMVVIGIFKSGSLEKWQSQVM